MLDAGTTLHQRVRGTAEVAMSFRRGRTALDRLHQSGAAKAMLPSVYGGTPEIVFLNTAGGLTGGDAIGFGVDLGPDCHAVATSQTAERIYDAGGGEAEVRVRLRAGRGARIDWLPQETIFYDRSTLRRRTEIDLAGDAECLALETLVFGRRAMGERIEEISLTDTRWIRREGRPFLVEPLLLEARHLGSPALMRGAAAVASLAFVARGAEDAAAAIAPLLDAPDVEAAASGWDGRMTLRAFAADALPLRRLMAAVLFQLRRAPLPRVWQI